GPAAPRAERAGGGEHRRRSSVRGRIRHAGDLRGTNRASRCASAAKQPPATAAGGALFRGVHRGAGAGPGPAERLVLVGAMIPTAGESSSQGWQTPGQQQAHATAARAAGLTLPLSVADLFYNGFSPAQAAQAGAWERDQAGTAFEQPWPRSSWPEVPT